MSETGSGQDKPAGPPAATEITLDNITTGLRALRHPSILRPASSFPLTAVPRRADNRHMYIHPSQEPKVFFANERTFLR